MPPESKAFDTCGVCRRTILRGERITEYITTEGATLSVCALCKGAAEDAGWVQAALAGTFAGSRPKRRRSLGLRQRLNRVSSVARGLAVRPGSPQSPGDAEAVPPARRQAEPQAEDRSERGDERRAEPGDEAGPERGDEPRPERGGRFRPERADQTRSERREGVRGKRLRSAPRREGSGNPEGGEAGSERRSKRPNRERILRSAVEVFNASGEPRKVAGLIRSLGDPQVTVRLASGGGAVVTIAWELSWYQWKVGVDDDGDEVRESGKGSEIGELAERDQRWNATVGTDGTVGLDLQAGQDAAPEAASERE